MNAPAEKTTSARGRRRNPRGEGGRLRDEIVRAATELLDESGDERTITLRSVARRVGIAAPSIYPHFADQPAIMFAVVAQEFGRLKEALLAAVAAAGDAPRDRLLAICHAYLDYAQEYPGRYRTMFGGLWVPDLEAVSLTHDEMLTLGAGTMQVLIDAMSDCVASGDVASTDPVADSAAVWVGIHGLAHLRVATPNYPFPADIVERVFDSLAKLKPVDG
ncbi:putative transcriptional regulator, TetR family protein [Flexivirga endophytica]|uniref:Transcriptional regulator, TetR family protein n=1 Tax=Flexivirga endophytica TaxID=1849103 RepID=A0A916T065_9MICO|nr:TetR/AcrR family transcriptional regulator [Flexivirga endophytica]GGB26098.1 putative transcriptional regulator, TetR family protein [Flexivirga endophytica]GHB54645.1 putative transcriptional regulator, TetR family protein [Flexivirga endophytica]